MKNFKHLISHLVSFLMNSQSYDSMLCVTLQTITVVLIDLAQQLVKWKSHAGRFQPIMSLHCSFEYVLWHIHNLLEPL